MVNCIVFDVDGTLADCRHRLHHVRHPGKKDWKSFFAEMADDPVHTPVALLFHALLGAVVPLVVCSARPEEYREVTEKWLWENFHFRCPLYMRQTGDFREDSLVKREMLARVRQDGWNPIAIIDDRDRVVGMWLDSGIPVFHFKLPTPPANVSSSHPLLSLLIGPSGAGKSTYARQHCRPSEVVSTDDIRETLCGDFRDQSKNQQVFQAVRDVAAARLSNGLRTVIDATHLARNTRLDHVGLAPPNTPVEYIVINRPMKEKLATAGWRSEVPNLLARHEQQFRSALRDILNGDGLPNVVVHDQRTEQ